MVREARRTCHVRNRVRGRPLFLYRTPEGLTLSDSTVLNALRDALGSSVPIFGGAAGDQWRFKKCWQFCGSEVLQDAVPFLLFGGEIAFSFGVESGWCPVGREGRVTEASGHVLRSIGGKPATEFYRDLLGNVDITNLGEYPLAIFEAEKTSCYLRGSLHTDEANPK
jgi:hypothetical protein